MFKPLLYRLLLILFLSLTLFNPASIAQEDDIDWDNLDALVEEEFGPIVTGTEQAKMVEKIGKEIAKWVQISGVKLSFKLIQNDEPNAFAFPNGNMYVLTGLFKTVDTENELAFVLAHEISHVVLQHGEKSKEFRRKLNVQSQDDYHLKAFTREQEYEADKYGVLFTIRAGYSPLGSVNWFNKMTNLGYEYPPLYEQYSDHPNFTQRVVQAFINIGTYYEYAKNFDYGVMYLNMGNWKEAAESFNKFLEKYPNYKEAYNNIGVALLADKVKQKNVEMDLWLTTAVSKVSFFKDNFDKPVRGNYSLATRDFVDAVENFTKALEYDKKFAQPYVNLALVNIFTREFAKAKQNLDLALKYEPNSFEAYLALGWMHIEQGNYSNAISAFQKARNLQNDNPQAIYNLAYSYQWNNDKEKAKTLWKEFLSIVEDGSFADKARENLTALETGGTPKYEPKEKVEDFTIRKNTNRASLAGVSIDDDMNIVRQVLNSPDNSKTDEYGLIWEYTSPDISIGYDSQNKVQYIMIFDPIKTGLEFVKNLNVGSLESELIKLFGRPEHTFEDQGHIVYNYKSIGAAFWISGGKITGIGVYRID